MIDFAQSSEGSGRQLVVHDVRPMLNFDSTEFEDLPAAGKVSFEGVVKLGERLIVLLDPLALTRLSAGSAAIVTEEP